MASMSEAPPDREETGFAFTEEDYTRRYSPEKAPVASAPASVAPQAAGRARLHGGGNSFMRARRRLAASAST
jgi:hypothetical protein